MFSSVITKNLTGKFQLRIKLLLKDVMGLKMKHFDFDFRPQPPRNK